MRFAITRKYIDEIREENCNGDNGYIAGYAYSYSYFSLTGISKFFVILINETNIKLVQLSLLNLKQKEIHSFEIEQLDCIKVKNSLFYTKVEIKTNGNKKFKFRVQNVRGFKDYQLDLKERFHRIKTN